MVSLRNIFSRQPSVIGSRSPNWPHIIWREWRNCDDEEYARHLFDLVVDEPTDWLAAVVLALSGVIFGAIGGWLSALLLDSENLDAGLISWWIVPGIVVGVVAGLQVALILKVERWSSWGTWLQGLIPNKLIGDRFDSLVLESPYFGLIVALGSGMGVGMTGALFFGQPNPHFYSLLVGLVFVFIAGFYLDRRKALINGSIGGLIGLSFGLFFGLGFAQLVGSFIIPLDVSNSARVVGLAVGVGAGLFLGRRAGLMSGLIYQVVAMALVLAVGLNLVLLGWLAGLLVGGVVAAASRMYLLAGSLNFADAYTYRIAYFWWLGRPFATEIEAALRQHASGNVWQECFRHLDTKQRQPEAVAQLISGLQNEDWLERFLARHTLVACGGEAVSNLVSIARSNTYQLGWMAIWLLHSIGDETTTRLTEQARHLRCSDCLSFCGPHRTSRPGIVVTYYGCRICGQSREFLYCPQGVVAVLDSTWIEEQPRRGGLLHRVFSLFVSDSPKIEEQAQDDGLLRVNWLARRELFDFDWVEIIQATDEEVERFAVQVGNDTDPPRDARYPQMQCFVAPECQLSENTLRVLRHTFGQVEQGEEVEK